MKYQELKSNILLIQISEIYGIANRMGRIPDFDKFDGPGSSVLCGQFLEVTDPQGRLLLEATYEAIVDSGNL